MEKVSSILRASANPSRGSQLPLDYVHVRLPELPGSESRVLTAPFRFAAIAYCSVGCTAPWEVYRRSKIEGENQESAKSAHLVGRSHLDFLAGSGTGGQAKPRSTSPLRMR